MLFHVVDSTMFVVVCFTETNEVDVVPNTWVEENGSKCVCWWPPYKTTQRVNSAKLSAEAPTEKWSSLAVKIMYEKPGEII